VRVGRNPRRHIRRGPLRGGAALSGAALLTMLTLFAPVSPVPQVTAATAAAAGHAPAGPFPDPITSLGRQGAAAGLAQPPVLTTTATGREDDGVLLTTPAPVGLDLGGAAIYDNDGDLVFWREGPYMDLEAITFLGRPALSMWDNSEVGGKFIVLNSAYEEIASYRMNGFFTDGHDFQISPDGSRVLLLGFNFVTRDLSEFGGSANAQVVTAVIQEQNVFTGEVLFEWNALDHIPFSETQEPLTGDLVDYVHANSLAYDTDGNVLMSARHTSTVYKINHTSGEVMWRFGGKNSDFTFPDPADRPSYQHDARRLPDGRLSLFDNGNTDSPPVSRGAVYALDETAMTAKLEEDLQPDPPVFAIFAGSTRRTGNGDTLVDYASSGRMVEFSGAEPVFTATFPAGFYSYRGVRADWTGTPAAPPDVTLGRPGTDGRRALSMSWNGATEVAGWRIETGPTRRALTAAKTVAKTGFSTAAEVAPPPGAGVIRVSALNEHGKVLGVRTCGSAGPSRRPRWRPARREPGDSGAVV
jgi:outer membrane protein assembly factor BamB